ncbi:hypothetical protein Tco_0676842 [Tanacetum coccineum]
MCGYYLGEGFCSFCNSEAGNSFVNDSNPNSFNDPPNVFTHPPQPQYKSYLCELCGNDSHYGYDCPPLFSLLMIKTTLSIIQLFPGLDQSPAYSIDHQEDLNLQRITASIDQSPLQEISIQDMEDLKKHYLDEMLSLSNDLQIKDYRNEKIDIRFRMECESMIDELKGKFNGMSIKINKKKELQRLEQVANLTTYPSQRFKSFCYDDDDDYDYEKKHSTILEKESDEFIKSSVEDLVPILSESKDTSESDSDCDLLSCDDFSPINVYEETSITYSNPLFDSNDDFTSSDDESLSDEDVLEDNRTSRVRTLKFLVYLGEPVFVSHIHLFPMLIEDDVFDPGGEIDESMFLSDMIFSTDIETVIHNSEGDIIYLKDCLLMPLSLILPSRYFIDQYRQKFKDELDNEDLKSMVKVFDPGIHENTFSPYIM